MNLETLLTLFDKARTDFLSEEERAWLHEQLERYPYFSLVSIAAARQAMQHGEENGIELMKRSLISLSKPEVAINYFKANVELDLPPTRTVDDVKELCAGAAVGELTTGPKEEVVAAEAAPTPEPAQEPESKPTPEPAQEPESKPAREPAPTPEVTHSPEAPAAPKPVAAQQATPEEPKAQPARAIDWKLQTTIQIRTAMLKPVVARVAEDLQEFLKAHPARAKAGVVSVWAPTSSAPEPAQAEQSPAAATPAQQPSSPDPDDQPAATSAEQPAPEEADRVQAYGDDVEIVISSKYSKYLRSPETEAPSAAASATVPEIEAASDTAEESVVSQPEPAVKPAQEANTAPEVQLDTEPVVEAKAEAPESAKAPEEAPRPAPKKVANTPTRGFDEFLAEPASKATRKTVEQPRTESFDRFIEPDFAAGDAPQVKPPEPIAEPAQEQQQEPTNEQVSEPSQCKGPKEPNADGPSTDAGASTAETETEPASKPEAGTRSASFDRFVEPEFTPDAPQVEPKAVPDQLETPAAKTEPEPAPTKASGTRTDSFNRFVEPEFAAQMPEAPADEALESEAAPSADSSAELASTAEQGPLVEPAPEPAPETAERPTAEGVGARSASFNRFVEPEFSPDAPQQEPTPVPDSSPKADDLTAQPEPTQQQPEVSAENLRSESFNRFVAPEFGPSESAPKPEATPAPEPIREQVSSDEALTKQPEPTQASPQKPRAEGVGARSASFNRFVEPSFGPGKPPAQASQPTAPTPAPEALPEAPPEAPKEEPASAPSPSHVPAAHRSESFNRFVEPSFGAEESPKPPASTAAQSTEKTTEKPAEESSLQPAAADAGAIAPAHTPTRTASFNRFVAPDFTGSPRTTQGKPGIMDPDAPDAHTDAPESQPVAQAPTETPVQHQKSVPQTEAKPESGSAEPSASDAAKSGTRTASFNRFVTPEFIGSPRTTQGEPGTVTPEALEEAATSSSATTEPTATPDQPAQREAPEAASDAAGEVAGDAAGDAVGDAFTDPPATSEQPTKEPLRTDSFNRFVSPDFIGSPRTAAQAGRPSQPEQPVPSEQSAPPAATEQDAPKPQPKAAPEPTPQTASSDASTQQPRPLAKPSPASDASATPADRSKRSEGSSVSESDLKQLTLNRFKQVQATNRMVPSVRERLNLPRPVVQRPTEDAPPPRRSNSGESSFEPLAFGRKAGDRVFETRRVEEPERKALSPAELQRKLEAELKARLEAKRNELKADSPVTGIPPTPKEPGSSPFQQLRGGPQVPSPASNKPEPERRAPSDPVLPSEEATERRPVAETEATQEAVSETSDKQAPETPALEVPDATAHKPETVQEQAAAEQGSEAEAGSINEETTEQPASSATAAPNSAALAEDDEDDLPMSLEEVLAANEAAPLAEPTDTPVVSDTAATGEPTAALETAAPETEASDTEAPETAAPETEAQDIEAQHDVAPETEAPLAEASEEPEARQGEAVESERAEPAESPVAEGARQAPETPGGAQEATEPAAASDDYTPLELGQRAQLGQELAPDLRALNTDMEQRIVAFRENLRKIKSRSLPNPTDITLQAIQNRFLTSLIGESQPKPVVPGRKASAKAYDVAQDAPIPETTPPPPPNLEKLLSKYGDMEASLREKARQAMREDAAASSASGEEPRSDDAGPTQDAD